MGKTGLLKKWADPGSDFSVDDGAVHRCEYPTDPIAAYVETGPRFKPPTTPCGIIAALAGETSGTFVRILLCASPTLFAALEVPLGNPFKSPRHRPRGRRRARRATALGHS